MRDRKGQPILKETKFAEINLIHIPFVSIREHLSSDLLKEPRDPATLMLSLIKEETPRLTVNLITGKIAFKTLELDLMPARMALYAFFAMQRKNCRKESKSCSGCTDCFLDIQGVFGKQKEIKELYERLCGTRPIEEMSKWGIASLSAENFNMYKGKIKQDLFKRFGAYALKDLEIASLGRRPNTRYGLRMDRNRIEIVY